VNKYARTPLAAAIMMAASTPTIADNSKGNDQLFVLDRVTVAATRTEQKIENVANSVSVITEDDIENNLSGDIRELIRYEPGVEVGSASGQDASRFGSKGFNIRGMDENRVKITVDGIDQASAFTPAGNPFQRAGRNSVDIDTLKRVEIVKGPASTLYGSDALGGIVAFTTKDPADYLEEGNDTGGSLKLRHSSADDGFTKTLTVANRTGKLESLLIYTQRDSNESDNHDDSQFDNSNTDLDKDAQEFDSDNILVKLQYQINDAHRVGLTVEDYKADTFTDMPSKLGNGSFANYSNYYFGDDTTTRQRVSIFHQWIANNAIFDQLNWQLDWQDSDTDQETHTFYDSAFNPFDTPTLRIKDYEHQEELWQLSAQFDKSINNHQLTYGFEYEETDLTNQQDTIYPTDPSSNDLARAVPLVEGKAFGLYLQDQITLMDGKLIVTPGVRYDNFEAEPSLDTNFTPPSATTNAVLEEHESDKATFRLGTVYKFTENTSVFAQYSQGFKSPDLLNLYYASERNYGPGSHFITVPNSDLDAEESDSYEVGLRLKGDVGNLEVVAFYNDYKDFIEEVSLDNNTYSGTTYDGVTQSQNIDEVTIKGYEARGALWLDQTINAPEGTTLQAAIAYAKGENKTDKLPLDSISPMKAVISLNYDSPNDLWGSSLHWTVVDSKDENDLSAESNFTTAGYGILDLTAYYNPTEAVSIRGGIFNITDKKYKVYEDVRDLSATTTDLDRYTQPSRNLTASVMYKF